MTPTREVYLEKCSEREKYLRKEIKYYKREIKAIKSALQTESDYEWYLDCLKFRKLWLTIVRHELHRLKGMDRAVVPKQRTVFASPTENFNVGDMLVRCKCGQVLDSALMKFCPNCGRKILWEKVK